MKIAVIFDTLTPDWEDADYKEAVAAAVPEAEYEIAEALMANGHEVRLVGFQDDVRKLLDRLDEFQPDLVFNGCESFMGKSRFDYAITALLEIRGYRYTGASPESLLLARDKATSKKILSYHSIDVPRFHVYTPGQEVSPTPDLPFPVIVKPTHEDASVGIARASVVSDQEDLAERVDFIQRTLKQPAIAEELIDGREFYVGVLGNRELRILPTIELTFDNIPQPERKIATYSAKWDLDYRKRWGIKNIFARPIARRTREEMHRTAVTAYRALELRDYGRIDMRVTRDQRVYVLEVNANPYISFGEDMANAAEKVGLDYYSFIETIVQEAIARHDEAEPR